MSMRASRLLGIAVAFATAALVWGQATREAYRAPFTAWKEASATLEADAGEPSGQFQNQADRASATARTYLAARKAYLASVLTTEDDARWIGQTFRSGDAPLQVRPEVTRLLDSTSELLTRTITTFASVKDPAIQQVRQAMERERVALNALNDALDQRRRKLLEAGAALKDAEVVRSVVEENIANANAGRARIAEHIDEETAAWDRYYQTLVEGAISTDASPAPANAPATSAAPAFVPKPSPAAVPLSRYTGAWDFPDQGLFFGPQPKLVDLVVRQQDGSLIGTLDAQFAVPQGQDSRLTLEFQGLIQQTRNQVFPVRTSTGASGRIELIPGAAFNLLEVNIQIEAGAVRTANFVLLKR